MLGSIARADSINRYIYATDDPINRTDANGKCSGSAAGAGLFSMTMITAEMGMFLWMLPESLAFGGLFAGAIGLEAVDGVDAFAASGC